MNLVWGGSYLVADIGLRAMPPGDLAAWRFLVASLFFFPLLLLTRTPIRLARRDVLPTAAIGAVAVAGSYLLSYEGIMLASSTDRAIVTPMEPVALAILAVIFLHERLRPRQWAGIAVACGGAYLLIARNALSGGFWNERQALGQGLMLASLFTEGMYSIIGKPLLSRYRPLMLTAWAMLFATLFLFTCITLRSGFPAPPPTRAAWGAILFLAIPCTVVGYTLWYTYLEHMPAGVLGVFIFLQPVMGVALGVRFRGERLTQYLIVGAILIVLGVWLTGSSSAAEPLPDPEPSA
ncbi:MAG TPA: DMT family transporter [Armatimonadota bacterium]